MIAGGTVVIAILGLAVAGIPFVTFMGVGAALVVAIMVIASLTLLSPAAGPHRLRGHNIDRFGIPGTKRVSETRTAMTTVATTAGRGGRTTCRRIRSSTSWPG